MLSASVTLGPSRAIIVRTPEAFNNGKILTMAKGSGYLDTTEPYYYSIKDLCLMVSSDSVSISFLIAS